MRMQHYGQQLKGRLDALDVEPNQVARELDWDDGMLTRLWQEEYPDPVKVAKVFGAAERIRMKPHLRQVSQSAA